MGVGVIIQESRVFMAGCRMSGEIPTVTMSGTAAPGNTNAFPTNNLGRIPGRKVMVKDFRDSSRNAMVKEFRGSSRNAMVNNPRSGGNNRSDRIIDKHNRVTETGGKVEEGKKTSKDKKNNQDRG